MRLIYKLIIMALFIGVPLVAGTARFVSMTQEELEFKIRERQMDISQQLSSDTDRFFSDIEKYLSTFLYNYGKTGGNSEEIKQLLLPMLNQFDEFRVMTVIGADGKPQVTMASGEEVMPAEMAQCFKNVPHKAVLKSNKIYYSDLYMVNGGDGLYMTTALPFPDGKRVLAVGFSADKLKAKFVSVKFGVNGAVMLLDKKGRVVAASERLKKEPLEDMSGYPFIKKAYSKSVSGVVAFKDKQGKSMLGAFSPTKNGWRVIVQEPENEAYFTALKMRNLAIIMVLTSILIAFAAGTLITRSIVKPMRGLVKGAEEIGNGNLAYKVGIRARGEIGFLARAFDKMSGSLHSREKAISSINETTKKITTIVRREMLAETALELVAEISNARMHFLVFLRDGEEPEYFINSEGLFSVDKEQVPASLIEGVAKAFEKKEVLESAGDIEDCGHVVYIPLLQEDKAQGALVIERAADAGPFSHTDKHVFGIVASSVEISLQNIRLLEETVEKTRMEQELKTAELVQQTLFPDELPRVPGFDIAGFIESASETGGDWYGFVHEPENKRIAIIIGDVTGHGVPAAMVTAVTYSFFRTLEIFRNNANRGVTAPKYTDESVSRSIELFDPLSPDFMLRCLNEIILKSSHGGLFMTLFASVYYYDTGRLVYANAGHNPPMLFREEGLPRKKTKPGEVKKTGYLVAKGVRLGDDDSAQFKEHEISLQPGDTILWYTDGLIECENKSGEEYGDARLKALFEEIASEPTAEGVKKKILDTAEVFYGDAPHKDDITLVVGKVTDGRQPSASASSEVAAVSGLTGKNVLLGRKALIVNSNREFRERLARFLRGYEAETVSYEDAVTALAEIDPKAFDLCILPIGGEIEQIALASTIKDERENTEFLFISSQPFDDIIPIFSEKEMSFRLIRGDSETCMPVLQVCIAKIFTKKQWGISPYLAHGTKINAIRVRDTSTRMQEAAPVFEFADKVGITGHALNRLRLIVDELLMNAMFDAPVDEQGKHIYASLDRTAKIRLSEGEAPMLEYGSDGNYFGIGVSDCFGALTRETVVRYLEKCLFNRDKQIDDKKGGAGLGMFQLYKAASHMVFNVAPGMKTEVLCFMKPKTGVKFMRQEIESIAFFERSE